MRGFAAKIVSAILISSICLSGCAKVEPLSDKDIDKCAVYIAGVINKFNKASSRGIVAVNMKEPVEDENGEVVEEGDYDRYPLPPTNVNAPTSDGGESDLTKVAEVPGISFSYKSAAVSLDYMSEDGFMFSPTDGYSFVSVTFTAKNTTSEEINCDIQARSLNFTATLGEVTTELYRTILSNDLTVYNNPIPAGESVDLSVLFQFPSGMVSEDITELKITAYKDGTRYDIPLK